MKTQDERIADLERRLALAEGRIAQLEQTTFNIRPSQPYPVFPSVIPPSSATPLTWPPFTTVGIASQPETKA